MSKVTQQAFMRRLPSDVAPEGEASARPREPRAGRFEDVDSAAPDNVPERDEDDAGAGVDLKATVTLSGEALAALLEEVKSAQRTPPAEQPSSQPSQLDGDEADASSRRGPQRRSGKT
jgi:hypothetical protein